MCARSFAIFCAAIFCLTTGLNAETADTIFAKANADYAAGNFKSAITGYESLAGNHKLSASVFYDLGNAYFRAGDFGRAILNYERALALNPNQPEAVANLRLVRDQTRALELTRTWPQEHLAFLTPNEYAWVAAATFWIAVFILAGFYFAKRRPVVWTFTFVLLGALCAGSIFVAATLEKSDRDLAIVTRKAIQARLATADNAGTVLLLPPGSEVRVLSTRGAWSYAELPNELRGWIPAASAERVRL